MRRALLWAGLVVALVLSVLAGAGLAQTPSFMSSAAVRAFFAITDGTNTATVTSGGALRIDGSGVTQPVSGSVSVSNFPATQPVSIASMPTTPVTGTFWPATQPVSGTVAANQGTDGAAAWGVYPRAAPTPFTCGLNAIAASLTQCQAAASSGQSHYITGIYVQTTTTTSGTFAIQSGTGTNCGTSTTAVFPVSGTSNRFNAPITTEGVAALPFTHPLKVTANHALCLVGVATNTISAQIVGYTQ